MHHFVVVTAGTNVITFGPGNIEDCERQLIAHGWTKTQDGCCYMGSRRLADGCSQVFFASITTTIAFQPQFLPTIHNLS